MSYSNSYEDSSCYDYGSMLWDAACDHELDRLEEQADEIKDRDDFQYEWDLIDAEREYAELENLLDAEEHVMPSHSGITNQRLPEIMMQVAGWEVGILFGRYQRGHREGVKGTTLRSHRPYQRGWYRLKGDNLGMHFYQPPIRKNK